MAVDILGRVVETARRKPRLPSWTNDVKAAQNGGLVVFPVPASKISRVAQPLPVDLATG